MSTYIEHCRSTVANINADELAAFSLGPEVGPHGSGFEFHQLGQMSLANRRQWIGTKLPRIEVNDVPYRLCQEVAFLTICLDSQPRLKPRVADFMGILAVEGGSACGLLTEDVSQGNCFAIYPRPASHDSRAMLYMPFSHLGPWDKVLDIDALEHTLAFDVNGQERLLDFTPAPIKNGYLIRKEACPEYWRHHETVRETIEDFTVTIPQDSPLGDALQKACDFPWQQ